MSTAAFWFYPSAGAPALRVDLPSGVAVLEEIPEIDAVEVVTMSGSRQRLVRSIGRRVRISAKWSGLTTAGQSAWRQMAALEGHLQAGGWCGFAADMDKAWAGWVGVVLGGAGVTATIGVSRGATTLPIAGGNAFGAWTTGAATMVINDEATLEEIQPPMMRSQTSKVVSLDSTALEIDSDTGEPGAIRDYASPVFARHRNFYPVLRLAAGQRLFGSDERRVTYSIDAEFVYDLVAVAALGRRYAGSTLPLRGISEDGGAIYTETLDGILRGTRAASLGGGSPFAGGFDPSKLGLDGGPLGATDRFKGWF